MRAERDDRQAPQLRVFVGIPFWLLPVVLFGYVLFVWCYAACFLVLWLGRALRIVCDHLAEAVNNWRWRRTLRRWEQEQDDHPAEKGDVTA